MSASCADEMAEASEELLQDASVDFEEEDVEEEELEVEEEALEQQHEKQQQQQPSGTTAVPNIDDATLDAFLCAEDAGTILTISTTSTSTTTTTTATSAALGAAQAAAFAAALQQRGVATLGVLPVAAAQLAVPAAQRQLPPVDEACAADHDDAAFEEEEEVADEDAPEAPAPPAAVARECASPSSSNGDGNSNSVQGYAPVLMPTPAAPSPAPAREQAAAGQASPSRLQHEGGAGSILAGRTPPAAQHSGSPPASAALKAKQRPSSAGGSPAARRPSSSSSTGDQRQRPPWRGPQDDGEEEQEQDGGSKASLLPEVLPATSWTVAHVCDWVAGLGLSQYRKKFLHHCVDGRLLLRLSEAQLRTELGIGPLGHRVLLLEAVAALSTADLRAAAAAAAAGVTAEELAQASGDSLGAAAALLVAGMVAQRALLLHRSGTDAGGVVGASRGGNSSAAGAGSSPGSAGSGGLRAEGRARSAPLGPSSVRERSASPQASGHGRASPGALGPAAGRTSVYEQRARILRDLARAQARAAATAGTASEVSGIARLARREVAALQGQLADLDRHNSLAVQHASGSVDTRGSIPWKHVGAGTCAADPFPERIARPWDASDVDLTFQPRISTNSQRIMSEARGCGGAAGGSSFLSRLDHDSRRREAKQKELEQRYYGSQPQAGSPSKAADRDLELLASFFTARGWASLAVSGSGGGGGSTKDGAPGELDLQLDEVVQGFSKQLGLGAPDSAPAKAILGARGGKKIAALAAAVRTRLKKMGVFDTGVRHLVFQGRCG